MKKITFLTLVASIISLTCNAQTIPYSDDVYRGSNTKTSDLVHTKLDVSFDFDKAYMNGKAWITLTPHFYPTDTLTLDAKGMDIKEVALAKGSNNTPLHYTYDSLQLRIILDKKYTKDDKYTVFINYTSKPNDLKTKGSAAITDSKGLYFINPLGTDQDKPTQIWTQGETEANSVWMPTIDKPNQKSTEEIYITVPDKFVTLSNGLLVSQKKNSNGTRTDYWKMDLPHAPYLFFMGIGDYAIVKDHYKEKEVSYYVDKKYQPYARQIFGNTPEMIGFYERILNVPYQWPKYDQIVGKDFVSGAMENTTATLHQESAYQNARQLKDGNAWEEVIAHELFHHWFGDLVTTESWSNITLNESFADYSEYLWDEYKYGKDVADEHLFQSVQGYLNGENENKNLVRFYYNDKEDVFDAVSYNKGGAILHMLRKYVGDEAFFKALNLYLTANKFKSAEASQLRLAFEEVTGQDLNWFWNQWYYSSGHPKLNIDYNYDDSKGNAQVIVSQMQDSDKTTFKLPIAIDIYSNNQKTRYNVWVKNKVDTFNFSYKEHPDLINVDADKVLLCEKKDNKIERNYIYQFEHCSNYLDRKEALEYFNENAPLHLSKGLNDQFSSLRRFTINKLSALTDKRYIEKAIPAIEEIANKEKDKKTQAAALMFLAKMNDSKYEPLFTKYVNDSSYSVSGAALEGLSKLQPSKSYSFAKQYTNDAKGLLGDVIRKIIMENGNEDDFDFVANNYNEAPVTQDKIEATNAFAKYLLKVNSIEKIKKAIDYIGEFRKQIPEQYRMYTDPVMKKELTKLGKEKGAEVEEYINATFK